MNITTDTTERRGELYGTDVVRSYGDAAAEYNALKDEAGVVLREDPEPLAPVASGKHAKPLELEQELHGLAVVIVVIDDQNWR